MVQYRNIQDTSCFTYTMGQIFVCMAEFAIATWVIVCEQDESCPAFEGRCEYEADVYWASRDPARGYGRDTQTRIPSVEHHHFELLDEFDFVPVPVFAEQFVGRIGINYFSTLRYRYRVPVGDLDLGHAERIHFVIGQSVTPVGCSRAIR